MLLGNLQLSKSLASAGLKSEPCEGNQFSMYVLGFYPQLYIWRICLRQRFGFMIDNDVDTEFMCLFREVHQVIINVAAVIVSRNPNREIAARTADVVFYLERECIANKSWR